MQILKGSDERKPGFNKFVPHNPHYGEISLDKKVAMAEACRQVKLDLSEWKDSDGSVFSSYPELLDYRTDKFIKRYPPNFCKRVRPELAIITEDNKIQWSKDAVRVLIDDFDKWADFKRRIDKEVLDWAEYNWEKEFASGSIEDRINALEYALDSFAEKYYQLLNQNNPTD